MKPFWNVRPRSLLMALATGVVLAAGLAAQPGTPRVANPSLPLREGRFDFHVLHGAWFVNQNRVTPFVRWIDGVPLGGRQESFSGLLVVRPLADGPAAAAEYELTRADSSRVRWADLMLYDSTAKRWTIRRANVDAGTLEPALSGAFTPEPNSGVWVGEFYGDQVYEGRRVRVRERWRIPGPNRVLWEQNLSADSGRTWSPYRHAFFTRMGDAQSGSTLGQRAGIGDTTVHRESAHTAAERRAERRFRPLEGAAPPLTYCCYALHFRRYVVPAGGETTLIDLFERENELARQMGETRGAGREHVTPWMENVALFRDLDRSEVYTWLRGFNTMDEMQANAVYFGSIWANHEEVVGRAGIRAMDAYALTSHDVATGFVLADRPAQPVDPARSGLIVATVYTLATSDATSFASYFSHNALPRLYAAGGRPVAILASYPFLVNATRGYERVFNPKPIEDTQTFAWFARFPDVAAYERFRGALERDPEWRGKVRPWLEKWLAEPEQVWRLVPVGRSRPIR